MTLYDPPLWDDDEHFPEIGAYDETPAQRMDRQDKATLLGFMPKTSDRDDRTCGLCFAKVDGRWAQEHFDYHKMTRGDEPEFAQKLEDLKKQWEERERDENND